MVNSEIIVKISFDITGNDRKAKDELIHKLAKELIGYTCTYVELATNENDFKLQITDVSAEVISF